MAITGMYQRRDTASGWSSANPVLAEGEIGYVKATQKCKMGDGVTAWNDLPFLFSDLYAPVSVASDLADHLSDSTDAHDGSAISFVPGGTLASTDVQSAIYEASGQLSDHLADSSAAHAGSAISFFHSGYSSLTVQDAVVEVGSNLAAHLSDSVDAHDASAISVAPTGTLSSTDVQAALAELAAEKYSIDNPPPQIRYALDTVGAGLPTVLDRIPGDHHYNTTDSKDYVMTGGYTSVAASDHFSSPDGTAISGRTTETGGKTWAGSGSIYQGKMSLYAANGATSPSFAYLDMGAGLTSVTMDTVFNPASEDRIHLGFFVGGGTASTGGYKRGDYIYWRTATGAIYDYAYSGSSTSPSANTIATGVIPQAGDILRVVHDRSGGTIYVYVVRSGVATLVGSIAASFADGQYYGYVNDEGQAGGYTWGPDDFVISGVSTDTRAWVVTIPAASNIETVNAVSGTGSTETLPDVGTATVHRLVLDANCTLTFPTAAAGKSFTLVLVQDATGSRTVTWPGTVKWSGASAPTLTTTANKVDVFTFLCADGTNWLGFTAGQNY